MHPIVRRTAAVLAVPALSLTALAATSAPASAAVDPAPSAAAASWLSEQLTDGVVLSPYLDPDGNPYPDYGLSIDAGLALDAVGGQDQTVRSVSDAIAENIASYTRPGFGTNVAAGGTAKALVFAQAAGDDPTTYGGTDLVSQLEERVATEGAIAGRIQDDWDPSNEFAADYANVIGQAYAAQGLDAAGSAASDAVTDFLLAQQCEAGWFRLDFSDPEAADQSCDADTDAVPDTDVTAIAVLALASQPDDADVATHLEAAKAWLLGAQRANGSFGGGPTTEAPNANSTGLSGWALETLGATGPAEDAAAWVRAHQATNVANCVYYAGADLGAIAYDGATLKSAQAGPMSDDLRYQTVRSTAQALPVLQGAQTGAGDPRALFTAEYVKAGGTKPVGVVGAAPGEALCAMAGEQSVLGYANVDGEGRLRVRIPTRTATTSVDVANADGTFGTVEINALGAERLTVNVKKKAAVGSTVMIRVRGLAPAETVNVTVAWPPKKNGATFDAIATQADRKGRLNTNVLVPNRPGTAKVKVTGQFPNRKAKTTFIVTR